MTSSDANDPILRSLASLPTATSNAARDARVRARCHAALEQSRRRHERRTRRSGRAQVIEAALIGGLCLFYLSTAIHEVVRLLVSR